MRSSWSAYKSVVNALEDELTVYKLFVQVLILTYMYTVAKYHLV